jgi:hypothetical protein
MDADAKGDGILYLDIRGLRFLKSLPYKDFLLLKKVGIPCYFPRKDSFKQYYIEKS